MERDAAITVIDFSTDIDQTSISGTDKFFVSEEESSPKQHGHDIWWFVFSAAWVLLVMILVVVLVVILAPDGADERITLPDKEDYNPGETTERTIAVPRISVEGTTPLLFRTDPTKSTNTQNYKPKSYDYRKLAIDSADNCSKYFYKPKLYAIATDNECRNHHF
ncbi:hypothetical protein MTO96_028950 [Rhipicephalus appendiculatus]